jgi:hypothetical protein
MPGAVWLGEHGSRLMTRYDVLCVHTIVGFAPAHAAHFSTRGSGQILQSRDTRFQSAANLEGNPRVIAIENEDHGSVFGRWPAPDNAPPLTDGQVTACAKIFAWAHKEHGIPLQLCPDSRPGSRGLAYHRQGIDGNWGGYRFRGRVPGGETWTLSRGKVCLPLDATEVLTARGWVPLADVDGEAVASWSLDTGLVTFAPAVPVEPFMADTVRLGPFESTPDHEWLVRDFTVGEWKRVPACEARGGAVLPLVAAVLLPGRVDNMPWCLPAAAPGRRTVVGCVTTIDGTLIVRQRGAAAVTGNCPTDNRIAQLPEILRRATLIVDGGPLPPPEEDDDLSYSKWSKDEKEALRRDLLGGVVNPGVDKDQQMSLGVAVRVAANQAAMAHVDAQKGRADAADALELAASNSEAIQSLAGALSAMAKSITSLGTMLTRRTWSPPEKRQLWEAVIGPKEPAVAEGPGEVPGGIGSEVVQADMGAEEDYDPGPIAPEAAPEGGDQADD